MFGISEEVLSLVVVAVGFEDPENWTYQEDLLVEGAAVDPKEAVDRDIQLWQREENQYMMIDIHQSNAFDGTLVLLLYLVVWDNP